MTWLFAEMFRFPMTAFVFGMEVLVQTMRSWQEIAGRTGGTAVDGIAPPTGGASAETGGTRVEAAVLKVNGTAGRGAALIQEETKRMPDTNMNDDMLKLVQYKIMFIKRGEEKVLQDNKDELVYDNMSESAYAAWKIADYCKVMERREERRRAEEHRYISDSDKYRIGEEDHHYISDSDRKYLRVYFQVLQRYPREKAHYERDQVDALRGIRRAIEECCKEKYGEKHEPTVAGTKSGSSTALSTPSGNPPAPAAR